MRRGTTGFSPPGHDCLDVQVPRVSLLILLALGWLSLRSLLVLARVGVHSSEAQLSRSFEHELRQRGLRGDRTGMGMDP
jgi:hypothetical protein